MNKFDVFILCSYIFHIVINIAAIVIQILALGSKYHLDPAIHITCIVMHVTFVTINCIAICTTDWKRDENLPLS